MCRLTRSTVVCPRCLEPCTSEQALNQRNHGQREEVTLCTTALETKELCLSATIGLAGRPYQESLVAKVGKLGEDFCTDCNKKLEEIKARIPEEVAAASTDRTLPLRQRSSAVSKATPSSLVKPALPATVEQPSDDPFDLASLVFFPNAATDPSKARRSQVWIDLFDGNNILTSNPRRSTRSATKYARKATTKNIRSLPKSSGAQSSGVKRAGNTFANNTRSAGNPTKAAFSSKLKTSLKTKTKSTSQHKTVTFARDGSSTLKNDLAPMKADNDGSRPSPDTTTSANSTSTTSNTSKHLLTPHNKLFSRTGAITSTSTPTANATSATSNAKDNEKGKSKGTSTNTNTNKKTTKNPTPPPRKPRPAATHLPVRYRVAALQKPITMDRKIRFKEAAFERRPGASGTCRHGWVE